MIGQTISHYKILEKLGEGGMGVVYKARDTHLDRFLAIKVLPAEKVADSERKKRFVQEAKTASALNHPNIIHIYDIDQQDGVDFIAMEFVPGKTLDQVIPRHGMRVNEALKVAIQMADALAAAHEAGIVHRDLKPGNLMVTDKGEVKVLDFGLAKLTEKLPMGGEDATLTVKPDTEEGKILGTVAYMSPEQAEGKKLDARSDIFSFGSVLYEMVSGKRAFEADSKASTQGAIIHKEPVPLSGRIPHDLEKAITRCLRKDRQRRWQTMADLKVALEDLKEESDSGVLTSPTSTQKNRRSLTTLTVIFSIVAVLVVAIWLWFERSRPNAPEAPLMVVPLTSYPGIEDQPTFSPDGSQVAFVWNGKNQDNDDIYVKQIGTEGELRLTTDLARDYSPAWSPDGSSIAFLRDLPSGRSAVMLVPPIGGTERKLAETSTPSDVEPDERFGHLAWSPDASSLAIVDRNSPNEPFGIFSLSIETGERRKLTSPPPGVDGDFSPAFSPDGRALAFERRGASSAVQDLLVQQLSGNLTPQGETRLVLRGSHVAYNPTWTLDGRQLICGFGIGFFPSGLWRVETDGSGSRKRLEFAGDLSDRPSLSRQRSRLAFTRTNLDLNIWRFALAGPHGQASPPVKFIASTRSEATPQFSPDGRNIVFASDRSGNFEIWVCHSDGSHAVQITSMGGPATGTPRWSPDGEHVVFDSSPDGNWDIFVVAAGGGKARRLTNQPSHEAIPSWSRDGKWIYYSLQSGVPQIWKVPAEGGKAVQVTHNGGLVAFESPDGKFLYFTKSEAGTEGLWKMSVGGGEETQVLKQVIAMRSFAITELGIYFLTRSNGEYSVQFFNLITSKTEMIAKVGRPSLGCLTVSPNGKTILCAQVDLLDSDLMLVENFH